MPNRIPVKSVADFAKGQKCEQVIVLAWDGKKTHCVTWGSSVENCAQAAEGGNRMKKVMNWDNCDLQPPIVKKLREKVKMLEAKLRKLEEE